MLPNLTMPKQPDTTAHPIGKYGRLRKRYLEQHRRVIFINLLTSGQLPAHLLEIDTAAQQQMELLTAQLAQAQGVTEQLKAEHQMEWVGKMNNIRHQAEETVLHDYVYAD